jgi:hypothetical protein
MRGWPLAIVIFFVVVVLMNAFVIYLAVTREDPVVESYQTLER